MAEPLGARCPNCGRQLKRDGFTLPSTCPHCGQVIRVQAESTQAGNMAREPSIEQRTAILEERIGQLVRHGYRVISRTQTTAQLVKPKEFSLLWALLWLLVTLCVFGLGILIYLFYYLAQKDTTVYLEVDPYGQAKVTPEWARRLIGGQREGEPVDRRPTETTQGKDAAFRVLGVVLGLAVAGVTVFCCIMAAVTSESPSYSATTTAMTQAIRTAQPTGTATRVPPALDTALPTPSYLTYAVQSGDTLSSIAAMFGTTAEAIMKSNGLSSTTIYSGTELLIPTEQAAQRTPTPIPRPEPTPQELIVDVPGILGKSAEDVRQTLGEPVEAWRAGEPDSPLPASEGGEWHVYQAGRYLLDAVFDPAGRMRRFILGASYEHLQEEGYRLDGSALRLLDRLGMTAYLSHPEPDREVGGPGTVQAWHWYDSNGYTIIMFAHPSYSYCVYLVEIRW